MADAYVWVKSLHVISVFAWMAGLFYLPRLFVYHASASGGESVRRQLGIMEGRLARIIMRPAAISSWIFGLLTAWLGGLLQVLPAWFVVKLVLVCLLTVFHVVLEVHWRELNGGGPHRSERYFRVINEVPTVLLIGIVVMVIVRPW